MIQSLRDQYELIDKEFSDPRTKNKFLVASPFPILGIIFAYVLLTKYIIPTYMKYRKAVEIKNVIIAYDVLQILLNIHITYVSLCSGYSRRYSLFRCRDLDFSSTDPDALTAMEAVYVYYINKIIEFSDTIFFALRKRDDHISFLHVYHHGTMAWHGWLGTRYMPGGVSVQWVMINSSIHVIMYTYYLLSNLGPKWQKYFWWKRYLTILQIIQFCYGLLAYVGVMLTLNECPEIMKRKTLITYFFFYICSILYLFCGFYRRTYIETSNERNKRRED